jgi:hypothetical protein
MAGRLQRCVANADLQALVVAIDQDKAGSLVME